MNLLFLSALSGITLFAVEVAFAYGLQGLLVVLKITDETAMSIPAWIPVNGIASTLIFVSLAGVLKGLLQWAQLYMQCASYDVFRQRLRCQLIDWAYHSRSVSSGWVSTLFNERTNATGTGVMVLQNLIVQLTISILIIVCLFKFSVFITSLLCITLVVLAVPMRLLQLKIRRLGESLGETSERYNRQLLSSLKNLLLIRIYGLEKREAEKAKKSISAYLQHVLTYHNIAGLFSGGPIIVGIAIICGITYVAQTTGVIKAGLLISYFYLFIRLLQYLSLLAYTIANFTFQWPQLEETATWWSSHIFNRDPKSLAMNTAGKNAALNSPIGWKLENISFRYPGSKKPIFENFQLNIRPGSMVAVTGPSGTGKSSLLSLLIGDLEPTDGKISVEYEGKYFSIPELKSEMIAGLGYVGPESFLLEGTILENITYGLVQTPSEMDLREAITAADSQFIYELPQGLSHSLTEQGHGLSAGQKQRLSLVRALLRRSKILILDEATANLDLETENRLIETFRKLKGKMTIIAATHRSGLLEAADLHVELGR